VTRLHGDTKNWWADPLFMSITVTPPELAREEIASNLCAMERRTHLAGDYTDAVMCGTLEGAVRSGIRAADEVLRNPTRFRLSDVEERLVRA
jgi:monoamine oxidase